MRAIVPAGTLLLEVDRVADSDSAAALVKAALDHGFRASVDQPAGDRGPYAVVILTAEDKPAPDALVALLEVIASTQGTTAKGLIDARQNKT